VEKLTIVVESELLVNCMILHMPTPANHPQANGAAERAVQSAKRSVEKMCEERKSVGDWPDHLPWILMGYNCSRQASTKLAPYTLLYGLGPTIPPAQKERMDTPLDLDDPDAVAAELLQRQQVIREDRVIAGENLLIAAARQTEQYATKMSGEKLSKVKIFREGDYVYLRPTSTRCEHITGSGLAINIEPRVLRVFKVRDDGAIELIGSDGNMMIANSTNLTKCYTNNVSGTIDLSLAHAPDDLACQKCGSTAFARDMILCDGCPHAWHYWCLNPPLPGVPEDDI
jgi:hypothetical protein